MLKRSWGDQENGEKEIMKMVTKNKVRSKSSSDCSAGLNEKGLLCRYVMAKFH